MYDSIEFCNFSANFWWIFDEFFSGFRAKFQKRVTSVDFQSNLRKQIRKLPKFLKFVKIIQFYSILFIRVLTPWPETEKDVVVKSLASTSAMRPPRPEPIRRILFGSQKSRKWRWKKKMSMIQQEHFEKIVYRNRKYVCLPHLGGDREGSGWAKDCSASCAAGCATSCKAPKFELTVEWTSDWSGCPPSVITRSFPSPQTPPSALV